MDPSGTEARGLVFMSESKLQTIGRTLTCYWIQRICGGRFPFPYERNLCAKVGFGIEEV